MILRTRPGVIREAYEELKEIVPLSEYRYTLDPAKNEIKVWTNAFDPLFDPELMLWKIKYGG